MTLRITKENTFYLEPGDLIQFTRGVIDHWAVYKGDEEVVHLVIEGGMCISSSVIVHSFSGSGKTSGDVFVTIDNMWKVANGSKVYKNNPKDDKLTPLPKWEIVRRALSRVGEAGYNLLFKNCEHFANWCRYDTERSGQVESFVIGSTAALAAVGVVGAVAGVAYWLSGSSKEKNREEKQSH